MIVELVEQRPQPGPVELIVGVGGSPVASAAARAASFSAASRSDSIRRLRQLHLAPGW